MMTKQQFVDFFINSNGGPTHYRTSDCERVYDELASGAPALKAALSDLIDHVHIQQDRLNATGRFEPIEKSAVEKAKKVLAGTK